MSSLTAENAKSLKAWPRVKLGEVCEFRRGLTYSKNDEVASSSMAVLRSNNVELETGKLNLGELKYLRDDLELPHEKFVVRGSILMCMANGSKAHLGKVAIIDIEDQFAFGGFMGLLIPDIERILSSYLYWVLTSYEFKQLIAGLTDGANINNLKFSDIALFELPLPPLSVQREIVARLEKELAAVERMVKGFEALKAEADQLFKSTLKETFENVSRGGAEIKSLDEIFVKISDGTHRTPSYCDDPINGVKFLSSKDVTSGKIDWKNIRYIPKGLHQELCKRIAPQRGDILLAKNGTTGVAAVVDTDEVFDIYVSLALLRPSCGNVIRYLWYAINSPYLKEQFDGSLKGMGVPNLHLVEIRKACMPLPSLSTQHKIVAKLDAVRGRCEKLKRAAEEGVQTAALMHKAILKEAFA